MVGSRVLCFRSASYDMFVVHAFPWSTFGVNFWMEFGSAGPPTKCETGSELLGYVPIYATTFKSSCEALSRGGVCCVFVDVSSAHISFRHT